MNQLSQQEVSRALKRKRGPEPPDTDFIIQTENEIATDAFKEVPSEQNLNTKCADSEVYLRKLKIAISLERSDLQKQLAERDQQLLDMETRLADLSSENNALRKELADLRIKSSRQVLTLPGKGNNICIDKDNFVAVCSILLCRNDKKAASFQETIERAIEVHSYNGQEHQVKKLVICDAEYLHSSVGKLMNLTELDLWGTNIKLLPSSIGQLGNLKCLKLSRTERLLELPEEIGDLSSLEKLNLHASNIKFLSSSIGQLGNLKILDLSSTDKLLELPEEIGDLSSLEKLDLWGTNIKLLPSSIGQLGNLKHLDLSYTDKLLELPEEIGDLSSLEKLNLHRSNIKFLPSSIGQLVSLKHLDLSNTDKLLELPEEIGDLSSLEKLDLTESNIKSLPPSIGRLGNLKHLDLPCTEKLLELPEEIGNLSSLEKLDLDRSNIKFLPSSIGQLGNLKHLDLICTRELLELPGEIGNLHNLEIMELRSSCVASLPDSIRKLTSLVYLGVYDTCISDLDLLRLARQLPFLGRLGGKFLYESCMEERGFVLACNRARYRMNFVDVGNEPRNLMPKLWSKVLCNATNAFDVHPAVAQYYDGYNIDGFETDEKILEPDAIYQLLAMQRESFLQLLDRNDRMLCDHN